MESTSKSLIAQKKIHLISKKYKKACRINCTN